MKTFKDIPDLNMEEAKGLWEQHGKKLPEALQLLFGVALQLLDENSTLKHRVAFLRFFLIKNGLLKSSEKTKKPNGQKLPKKKPRSKDPYINALQEKEYQAELRDIRQKQANKADAEYKYWEQEAIKHKPSGPVSPNPKPLSTKEALILEKPDLDDQVFTPNPAFAKILERLSCGFAPLVSEEDVPLEPKPESHEGLERKRSFIEERYRYEFNLNLIKYRYLVIKYTGFRDGEEEVVSPSFQDIGPPRSVITWEFLTNLNMSVSQLYLPFNRLSMMLSTEDHDFSSSNLALWYGRSAEHLAPIYIQLAKDLSNAYIISGDDTVPRCREIAKYFEKVKENKGTGKEDPAIPWDAYANRAKARDTLGAWEGSPESKPWARPKDYLGAYLGAELDFVSLKQDKEKTQKKGLYLSVLTGRARLQDPDSQIVFYRSHFGGVGNLIEDILRHRTSQEPLIIQTDMAKVNPVADKTLVEKFKIRYAGCLAHARRPFKIHEDDDPRVTRMILLLFQFLAMDEKDIAMAGKTEESILIGRAYSAKRLEKIKEICGLIKFVWAKNTPLGAAARYVEKYYQELTLFLTEPFLDPDNNLCERLLRAEKKILDSAGHRGSIRGRLALDVNRTILQTAVAAGVNPQWYLNEIYRIPAKEIEEHPEKYTPLNFLRAHEEKHGSE